MADDPRNPAIASGVEVVLAVHLFLVHDREKAIGAKEHQCPVESGRRHSDDGEGMLVDLNRAAYRSAVVVETGVPVRVGQNDIRSAVRSALVGRVEEASEKRANLQDVEGIP